MLRRRHFLASLAGSLAISTAGGVASEDRPPRILLRSSWQVVNIGDIAHTPGVLALIEKYLPHAEVILWASGAPWGLMKTTSRIDIEQREAQTAKTLARLTLPTFTAEGRGGTRPTLAPLVCASQSSVTR